METKITREQVLETMANANQVEGFDPRLVTTCYKGRRRQWSDVFAGRTRHDVVPPEASRWTPGTDCLSGERHGSNGRRPRHR